MAKNVLGAAAGAGAATVYLRPDLVAGYALDSLFPPGSRGYVRPDSGSSAELVELQKLLAKDVRGSNSGVTIVHSNTDKATGYATYTLAVLGVGAVAYLTVFRGWRLSDFMYVTRRNLQQGLSGLSSRLEAMSGRLVELRARMQAKLNELAGKQDETIAAQKVLSNQIKVVGKDVENTCSQVRQIHGLVYDMDASLIEVGTNQRHANHGIYILCKAVGELMAGHNIPSKTELVEYTQHPMWNGDKLQGLQGVLGSGEAAQRRLPFLLNGAATRSGSSQGGVPTEGASRELSEDSPDGMPVVWGGARDPDTPAAARHAPPAAAGLSFGPPRLSQPAHSLMGLVAGSFSRGW
ncbi:hypothetical protein H632_c464p0 [Helicosporidium sp. ATCC 50920]|nr:hypothetical protein H632_c464p0 [Helicosporidium sp. ATCC 50920]|eukprot:KDD75865.1 hypothetical protein H632_c464p0 [Helicosporidium sp. ATCC 50920]